MLQDSDSPGQLAEAIRHVADSTESEMDLQVKVAKLLGPHLPDVPGASPEKYGHHATRFRGIQDALHGNLIIEYERPGKLAKPAGLDECLRQLREYLTQEAQQHGNQATSALRRMVGVGLDGEQIVFVRFRGKGAEPFIAAKKRRPQLTFFPDAEAQDFYVDGPHVIENIRIPKFESANPLHKKLAALSQRAHNLAAELAAHPDDEDTKRKLAETEDEIDRAAAKLWGLTDPELDEIRKALELLQ